MLRQLEKLAKRATAAADDVPGFFCTSPNLAAIEQTSCTVARQAH